MSTTGGNWPECPNICDFEYKKFKCDADGNVALNVCVTNPGESTGPKVPCGYDTIPFDSTTAAGLTPPADAVGANVVVYLDDICCEARAVSDGSVPSATNGRTIWDCGELDIGCTIRFPNGSPGDMANFSIIGLAGCTGRLEVMYLKQT